MSVPVDYANRIVDLLQETDRKTAGIALRIADALISYREAVEVSSALAQVDVEMSRLSADRRRRERNAATTLA